MMKRNKQKDSLAKRRMEKLFANKKGLAGLIMVLFVVAVCFGAALITPYDPNEVDVSLKLAGASPEHIFGCDAVGRDVLSRLLYGGQMSIIVGVVSALCAALIGTALGCLAGYYGGKVDAMILYVTEIVQSFPSLLLVLILVAFVEASVVTLIVIFAVTGWTSSVRIVRGRILSLKTEPYVDSCRVNGVRDGAIMFKHLLPNALGVIILNVTLNVGVYILSEAGMSFLGVGVPKSIPTWGNMFNAARSLTIMQSHPLLWVVPGVMISIMVLGINFLGDGLRDAFDVAA